MRGVRGDATLGNAIPNLFSTEESSSVNVVYFTVLLRLLFCFITYYSLSKHKGEKMREQEQEQEQGPAGADDLLGLSIEVEGISGFSTSSPG